ncbi:MAG: biotin/lipoyl-binding protein, partial [Geminicoccaceae bacterium]
MIATPSQPVDLHVDTAQGLVAGYRGICEMRIRQKAHVLAALVTFALTVLHPAGTGAQTQGPQPVEVATPLTETIIDWDEYTGRFRAVSSVVLQARVSGYLQAVHFEEGALVQKGDLLFEIDRRPFEAAVA